MSQTDSSAEFGDLICEIHFAMPAAKRWSELCRFLDGLRDHKVLTKCTRWQRTELMSRHARVIGAALVKRDPSLQPYADALLARYPVPDDHMVAEELGAFASLH